MAVHVVGTVHAPIITEPASPFAVAGALHAGKTSVITVGPYTNTGDTTEDLSNILVSNAVGVTVNSAVFTPIDATTTGTDSTVVEPGSTASVDVNVTADSIAPGETADFSFDVDVTSSEEVVPPVEPPVVTPQ